MYNTTAFLYERIAAFDEPEKACDEIHTLLVRNGLRPPGLIGDFGSGTGLNAILLAQKGWRVYGVELSHAMLSVATENLKMLPPDLQSRIQWTHGDITRFRMPEGQLLDGAICLHNTLNHLVDRSQLQGFIHSAYEAIAPKGVFLVDSDTRRTFEEYFHHDPVVVWDDGIHRMTRACTYHPDTGRADHTAVLERYDESGGLVPVSEEAMPLQYYPENELAEAFKAAGFQVKSAKPFNPSPRNYSRFFPKVLWVLRKA